MLEGLTGSHRMILACDTGDKDHKFKHLNLVLLVDRDGGWKVMFDVHKPAGVKHFYQLSDAVRHYEKEATA